MSRFSQLAETLVGSEIVRLGNVINERTRNGETIFNFTIGDFDPAIFPIPPGLKLAIQQAYQDDFTNYPPAEGILDLRKAIAGFVSDWYGLHYGTTEILVASGGRPLIYAVFKALVDPGDKVIYAVPSWNNNHYTHMNGGEHCIIATAAETDFMPTAASIEPHLGGAALLCLCTPQNPTGTTLGQDVLEDICDLVIAENNRRGAGEKKLYVMFDQMYALLTYGDTHHYNPVSLRPEMKKYTIIIDGISKCFAATGVRVGWALGPAALITKMKSLLTHIGAWAPMAEQVATASYLHQKEEIREYLDHLKASLDDRLKLIYQGIIRLKEAGHSVDAIFPRAGLYLTIKFDLAGKGANDTVLQTQKDVTDYLLSEAKLAIVPFYAFGAEPDSAWYRLSAGTCQHSQISEMLEHLAVALAKLS